MNKLYFVVAAVAIMTLSAVAGFKAHQYLQVPTSGGTDAVQKAILKPENIIGSQRPDFTLMDMQGQERHISEWDGKTLVVNFWATWCPPCREEIPEFIKLQEEFGPEGLQFLGIALQSAEEVLPFYDEIGMNYPTLVGQEDVIRVAKRFGNDLGALPYTALISKSGEIRFVKRGPLSAERAREVIKSLL